ncbi:MAG TPA: Gfo/Idh/MocA family oxidoreductase [bacterium]|nr:Gfo/Idh/MocA family oxidoreductase [bacterium]
MEPLGIGLVGLGRWGRNYLKTLTALPECRLVAVADSEPAGRAAVADLTGSASYDSMARLLSDPAVEAVVVATPDRTHYSLSVAALEAGRDVLVEKPMTLTSSEAEMLVARAAESRLVIGVGHTAAYSADIGSLRTLLDALPRDSERRVVAERTSSGPPASRQSSVDNHQSSILFDLCPHDIALAVLLFGTPTAARGRASGQKAEYEIRFDGDGLVEGRAEWRQPPHVRRFEVAGDGEQPESAGRTSGNRQPAADIRHSPLGRQCLDFIESCRTRTQPLSNGPVGLSVVRCLEALARSSADGGSWIALRPEMRAPDSERRAPESAPRPLEIGVRA